MAIKEDEIKQESSIETDGEPIELEIAHASEHAAVFLEEKKIYQTKDNFDKLMYYKKILALLKSPSILDMFHVLSPKEIVIICLRLGYIDGHYFTEEAIADFLELNVTDVHECIKKLPLIYFNIINDIVDEATKKVMA